MPSIYNAARDAALNQCIADATRLYLCSAEPTTFAQASSTLALANKTGITLGAPEDATPNGRWSEIPEVTDGVVTAAGQATHWALTNNTDTVIATGPLTAPVDLVLGPPAAWPAQYLRVPAAQVAA